MVCLGAIVALLSGVAAPTTFAQSRGGGASMRTVEMGSFSTRFPTFGETESPTARLVENLDRQERMLWNKLNADKREEARAVNKGETNQDQGRSARGGERRGQGGSVWWADGKPAAAQGRGGVARGSDDTRDEMARRAPTRREVTRDAALSPAGDKAARSTSHAPSAYAKGGETWWRANQNETRRSAR